MTLVKIGYKIGLLRKEIEFFLVTGCLLFLPDKTSYTYFLVCSLVIIFFLIKELVLVKNVAMSGFSTALLVIILVFSPPVLFSVYKLKSLLLVTDILLVCLYFFIFYLDRNEESRYFRLLLFAISLFSALFFLNQVLSIFRVKNIFFENPILQGIASGLGVLIALYFVLKSFKPLLLACLLINIAAVFTSGSKAAFIGILFTGMVMVILKKRWLIPVVLIVIAVTFIIPNPVRNTFEFSLKHDPYLLNRLDIWKLSWKMFGDHLWTGVGPDNFLELSKKYNFKQEKGPANYFKIPRSPHSDYLKIVVETGVIGLAGLVFLLFLLVRKLFSPPFFDLSKMLLFYVLFQALLFNFVFQFFFLFLVIFLAKNLFEKKMTFSTLGPVFKWFLAGLGVIVFLFSYLFPFLAHSHLVRSRMSRDYVGAFGHIGKAEFFSPLDHSVYHSRALLFLDRFKRGTDMDSFYHGIKNLKKAQRLNVNHLPSHLLEFEFYRMVLEKKLKYSGFLDEALIPLRKAEQIAPRNPFIPLIKAQLFLEFNLDDKAKAEALKALEIEPNYIAAHYFLQDNFGYFGDPGIFRDKIQSILDRAAQYPYEPGSYLDNLFTVPRLNR